MQKKCLIIIVGIAMMMPFISGGISTGVNGSIGIDLNSPEISNYSTLNVNNSQYFQGYTPSSLYDYFKDLFDLVYCKLTGCTMTGNLNVTANITSDRYVTTNNLTNGICTNASGDTFFGYIEGAC